MLLIIFDMILACSVNDFEEVRPIFQFFCMGSNSFATDGSNIYRWINV